MNGLLLAAVLAATPITLEEARTEGRSNVQALQSLLDVESAQGELRVARSALLPQVGFNTSAGGNYIGRRVVFVPVPDPTTGGIIESREELPSRSNGSFNLGLDVNQTIYDHARWKQLAQSGARVEAARGEALEQSSTSELEAIRRFMDLLRTQATIEVLQATVRRSEEQLERARAMFQAGRVGRGEELAAQVNLGNDRIAILRQQALLATNQAQLAVWLARPGTADLVAVDPGLQRAEPVAAPSLEEALAEARRNRPLLQALQAQVRAASLGIDIVRADYLPRLGASGSFSRSGPDSGPVFTEPRLQNSLFGGVSLTWNLFNGLNTNAQVDRARAALRRMQLAYAQTERELEAEVRRSLRALEAQVAAARLAAVNREAALQSLTLAEERFRAGAGSTLDVRDAQLKLTQAELALLESRIDVETARFTLMRVMGTLRPGDA